VQTGSRRLTGAIDGHHRTGIIHTPTEVSYAHGGSSGPTAVAPVAGLRRPTPCPTTRAVSVIAFHGTADQVDPYHGHGQAYWTYSVPTAASDWATQDRCTHRPQATTAHG
jgi:poly(3-hydroxybutyrate) depolymerase